MALLRLAGVQRDQQSGPAAGFDAKAVRNDLIRAIDTSPIQLPRLGAEPAYLPRKVNVEKTVTALDNRTAAQIAEIRQSYVDHEGRTLDDDLFGQANGGTDLKPAERARIAALLRGSAADTTGGPVALTSTLLTGVGMSPEQASAAAARFGQAAAASSQESADDARTEAMAAELRPLLIEKPNESERERIMALLRNEPARNGQIAGHYTRLFHDDLYADLRKYLEPRDADRAEKLVIGDRNAADAIAVEQRMATIAELTGRIADYDQQVKLAKEANLDSGIPEAIRAKLEEKRREEIAAQQAVLERARQEATALAGPTTALGAGAARIRAILGQKTVGGTSLGAALTSVLPPDAGAVLAAMASGSAPDLAAARIYQAVGTPTLTSAYIETELRGLRTQAAADAQRELTGQLAEMVTTLPMHERAVAAQSLQTELPKAVAQRTTAYFTRLRDSYAAKIHYPGHVGNAFDDLIASQDSSAHTTKLAELIAGQGRLGEGPGGDLRELQLALHGDHHDIDTVIRVLSGKSRAQINELITAFDTSSPKSLATVLFGRPASTEESVAGAASAVLGIGAGGALVTAMTSGKASAHDAFVLRELLDTPDQLGGPAEAEFLAKQTQGEAQWAVSDSGTWGKVYDATGNETKDLMEETSDTAGVDVRLYRSFLAAGNVKDAEQALADLRQDRARMRGDRAAYSASIDKFRSQLATALTMAVDIAVMVLLPEAAPFLVGVAATAAGHVAANLIAYGDKYSGEMLKNDLLTAIGAAAGAKLAGMALAGRAAGTGVRVAEDLADEVAISASQTIATEASGYASESVLTLAKRQAWGLTKEIVENEAGAAGGELAAKGHIDTPSLTGIGQGIATGRIGRALKGGGHQPASAPDHPAAPEHPSPPDHTAPADRPSPNEHPTPVENPTPEHAATDPHTRKTAEYPVAPDTKPTPQPSDSSRHADANHEAARRADDPEMDQPDVKPVDAGEVFQSESDPNSEFEAYRILSRLRARDPYREAGMMWNRKLQQWAVVQGGPKETLFGAAKRKLGWARDDVDVDSHVHPIKKETGATTDLSLVPSVEDVRAIARESARGGPELAKAWEAIKVTVDRGPGQKPEQDRTWIFYDRKSHTWTIFYPLPGPTRGRGRITVNSVGMYRKWRAGALTAGPDGKPTLKDVGRVAEPAPHPDTDAARRIDDEPGLIDELDRPEPDWKRPQGWRLPAENKGSWNPPNSPGEGWWTPHDPGAYGLESGQAVRFRKGVPDFSDHVVPTPAGHPGWIEVEHLTGDPADLAGEETDNQATIRALAKREGCTEAEIDDWLRAADLVLHHQAGDVMQIVPGPLHRALGHRGSASAMRDG